MSTNEYHAQLDAPTQPSDEAELMDWLQKLSEEFDQRTVERADVGAEKYGPGKFLTVDTLEEAIEEILDLANYARFTFIKLRMLQATLANMLSETPANSGFIKTADLTKVRNKDK